MAGVYRQPLSTIAENAQNTLVIGVIISTVNPRTFESASINRRGSRCVWTFTLRDSEHDTINVTVWGTEEYVNKLVAAFHIGSVVDVINAKVLVRKINDRNDMFVPSVTSSYTLTINEGAALIQDHDGADQAEYQALLQLPTRNVSTLRSLKSIIDNIEAMTNQFVDIILVVTFVGEARDLMTRDGRSLRTRDFEATDNSYEDTVAFKLWENEWVMRSGDWEPRNTVILLTDAQITFNNFKKKTSLTIVRKTLITENPNIPQTAEVKKSIKSDTEYMPHDPYIIPKPESITNVMTIHEISERLNKKVGIVSERVQFVAIVYAEIAEINLENIMPGVLIIRCALCKRIVQNREDSCMNLNCACGNGRRNPQNIDQLYIKINLKDKTGYLIGCRLTGTAAERALGCTAEQFRAMTHDERVGLKVKFLLELFDVRLQVLGPSTSFNRALYNILSISPLHESHLAEEFNED